jgi:hypothetical protein
VRRLRGGRAGDGRRLIAAGLAAKAEVAEMSETVVMEGDPPT